MNDKTNKNLKEAGLKATLPRIKILEILKLQNLLKEYVLCRHIFLEEINQHMF